jgi:glycosyltransferase involved in cell wall biosynthesis
VLLTAALIVRDEERRLPACLESLRELVDEIVVVDTGSRDGTIAVAQAFGARVFETHWAGDFAAARNVALDHARGEWILSIDADERVAAIGREELELDASRFAAHRVLLRPTAGCTPFRECRLFRNVPEIRFERAIHERVSATAAEYAARNGLRIGACPLLIEHTGYDEPDAARHERDLPLLLEHLRLQPDDFDTRRRLGDAYAGLGERDEARRAYFAAVEAVRATDTAEPVAGLCFSSYARWLADAGEATDSLLAEARERFPGNHLLAWLSACAAIARGDDGEAMEWLERLRAVDVAALPEAGLSYDERLFGAAADAGLAGCLFRLGRYDESVAAYDRAVEAEPGNVEYRAKRTLAAARTRVAVAV